MTEIIGVIGNKVLELLNIETPEDFNIYIGNQNIKHMIENHPFDYEKYGNEISNIIEFPDYVGYHNDSIEYVKGYANDEYIKVAVRTSKNGRYFARTIFSLNRKRVETSINNGALKKFKS